MNQAAATATPASLSSATEEVPVGEEADRGGRDLRRPTSGRRGGRASTGPRTAARRRRREQRRRSGGRAGTRR